MPQASNVGLGLRIPHLQHVLKERPSIPWFEVHICNFLRGGLNRELLRQVSKYYPLSFHGVSLNLGGTDPLNNDYLTRLKKAVDEFEPIIVSEHACFTALESENFNDLLPVPYTEAAVEHFSRRIDHVQDFLGRQILIENVSRYASYKESTMNEAQFLSSISDKSGCGILLDLNNAYVNQCNLGESLDAFVEALPLDKVGEIHLAGHSQQNDLLVDTHNSPVCDAVWSSYRQLNQQLNQQCLNQSLLNSQPLHIPVLIEWDSDLPDFERLQEEQQKAQAIMDDYAQQRRQRA